MANTINRKYNCPDTDLSVRAALTAKNLEDLLPLLTPMFPWLDAAWVAAFKVRVKQAMAMSRDEHVLFEQTLFTDKAKKALADALAALNVLNGYAKLAYPTDRERRRSFGQDTWKRARTKPALMKVALEQAYKLANQDPYKTELMQKGMTQADIDLMDTLATTVEQEGVVQKESKKQRPVKTRDRISAHNGLFKDLQMIRTCTRMAFPGDEVKEILFEIYAPGLVKRSSTFRFLIMDNGQPVQGASIAIEKIDTEGLLTNATGRLTFRRSKVPEKFSCTVTYPNGTTRMFEDLKVKKGRSSRWVLGE